MKMIPLVMANEPGTAQLVNREPWFLNCSLCEHYQRWAGRKSFWKKASERVRIPAFVWIPGRTVCLFRVAYFGIGALNGW